MLLKYLKLRTIRILREKYLDDYTCIAVTRFFTGLLMMYWYREQVEKYANVNGFYRHHPFHDCAVLNRTKPSVERLKFLVELEFSVQEGLA